MTKLDELYRKAPQLESPATLDDRVLRSARSRVPQAAVSSSKQSPQKPQWWGFGYAVSYLCVLGVGLGVLLQAGFFPASFLPASLQGERDGSSIASDAASTDVAHSESDNLQREIISTERSRDVKEDARIQSRMSAAFATANPSVFKDTSVAIDTDSNSVAFKQPIAAADSSALMTVPEAASLSVDEFSKSQSPSLTVIPTDSMAESAADAASVAGIDAADTNTASANIQAQVKGSLPVQDDLLAQSPQLSDSQSAMTTRSIDWLLSQAPDHYTVKIAAGSTADAITLLGNELSITTVLVQINDGEDGWLLLHGSFSDKQNAELVLPELFESAYLADAAVDEAGGFIKLEVIPYAVLHDLVK